MREMFMTSWQGIDIDNWGPGNCGDFKNDPGLQLLP